MRKPPTEQPKETKKKKKVLSNEKFLQLIKEKDLEKSKYLQALLPVDPDKQKFNRLEKFAHEFQEAIKLFTPEIQQKTLNLMQEISVQQIETFPSHLIKKIIPKINPRQTFLKQAYKFILEEEKLWPNVKIEVMFMDYLFNPEHKVKRDTAVYIICLLLDLQEDYRYNIKRGFLKNILQSEIERKRLQLEKEPPEFPICTIKAPVPWKCSVQVAKNRLEEVLMVNHPLLQAIQILWCNLYNDLLIVDTSKFYKCDIPYHADNITEIINNCCKITRDVRKCENYFLIVSTKFFFSFSRF